MKITSLSFHASRAPRARDVAMNEFDMPRLGVWVLAIVISFGIWAVLIGGMSLL